jgi:hypothetical protein
MIAIGGVWLWRQKPSPGTGGQQMAEAPAPGGTEAPVSTAVEEKPAEAGSDAEGDQV